MTGVLIELGRTEVPDKSWVRCCVIYPLSKALVQGDASSCTSAWIVTVGQAVQTGQLIALNGNEGRSTGPHLHFEKRIAGQPVDPIHFYAAHGAAL